MKKSKVIYYPLDKRDSTSWWRICGVLPYIQHEKFDLIDISENKIFDWTIYAGKDIFIIQRPFSQDHATLITAAKNAGLKVIIDLDDDLWNVPTWNPTYTMYKQHQGTLNTCVSLADEVWVSTEAIKKQVQKVNPSIQIIPNALNDYQFKLKDKRKFNFNKRVLWRGGSSHAADVEEHEDYLVNLINKKQDFTFTFIGDVFHRIARKTGDNCEIMYGLTIVEFFRYLNNLNPSAMFFPLQDNLFNNGKSNISFIESSYAGSAFFGMNTFEQFNKPGVTAITAMHEYLDNPEYMSKQNSEAWEYVKEHLLLSSINKLRTERILANL